MEIYLAPLRGVTDYVFRNTFMQFFNGIDKAVTPFISKAKGNKLKKSYKNDILPENNISIPIIPQILTNNTADFIFMAEHCYEAGYELINWNLGCPHTPVMKKKRGAGLLPYPEQIEAILESIIPNIHTKLSIKARLGADDNSELIKLISMFNKYPLTELIIHPRTGTQMYGGEVNLDVFAECLALSEHPVVYNGDINSLDVFKDLSERFKSINKWMIGRAAITNPFLPGIIKQGEDDPSINKINIMKDFHDSLFEGYSEKLSGPIHLINCMKGFWNYFAQSFDDSKKVFKKIKKTTNLYKYNNAVNAVFNGEFKWIA